MKVLVRMTWSEGKNQWHMETLDGTFIQEFYNCSTFQRLFKGLDKDMGKLFKITVEEYIDDGK